MIRMCHHASLRLILVHVVLTTCGAISLRRQHTKGQEPNMVHAKPPFWAAGQAHAHIVAKRTTKACDDPKECPTCEKCPECKCEDKKAAEEEPECECVENGLEEAKDAPDDLGFKGPYIARAGAGNKTAYYPKTYGSKCEAWEDEVDPACKGDFPPTYCASKWCYVDKKCKVDDTKKTLYFPGKKLYYSYKNCGSFDSFTAQACLTKGEDKCKDPCGWNKANDVCQNKLCQCTGHNKLKGKKEDEFGEDYGEKCDAWDKGSCDRWKDSENALGLWCCKQWCYVDESCPSAQPSAVAKGLFYTYYTCPDDVDEIKECPWKKPVDFAGKPLPLSKEATEELKKEAEKKKKKEEKSGTPAGALPSIVSFALFLGFATGSLSG